ncbi:MAG: VOC family protein, partial [Planctomycetes bacterium]|nr:VOC family protein [Planctomycetota bacterium]
DINRIILYANDFEKSVNFYKNTLGLKVKTKEEGWAEFDTGQATLCLHHGKKDTKSAKDVPIVIFSVSNFDKTYVALRSHGIKVSEPSSPCAGARLATFIDPSGNVLEIEGC